MRRVAGCLLFIALLFASDAFALDTVGSLWGGIWHKTNADGSQVDCLDVGLNDSSNPSLAGLTFSVTGPGFAYTFTAADLTGDSYNPPEMYHEFSTPLPPGLYTFTLNDGAGNVSKVTDTHVSAPSLPRVDPATIKFQRDAGGFYRFSWAPVNDTRTYDYRLVVVLDNPQETAVYYGSRSMVASDTPVSYLQNNSVGPLLLDNVAYKARVEIHDSPAFETVTNRSYSGFVKFTPQPADYNPAQPSVAYATVYSRFESDGTLSTDLSLAPELYDGITSASVSGPDNFSYNFDLLKDRDPTWPEFYKNVTTPLSAGLYTFHLVGQSGADQYAYSNLSAPVSYPAPNAATYRAEDQGDGSIRFSWAGVNHSGALYYRVYLKDPSSEQYVVSARTNATYADLQASDLAGLATPQWRVEVFDSSSITTQRNRVLGPAVALAVIPFDSHKPSLSANIANATNFDGQQITDLWMDSWGASVATAQMHMVGPDGSSRDVFTPGGYTDFLEPVTPAPGLYSFTAVDSTGKSTTRYHYLTAAHHIDPVDFRTVNVNREVGGQLSLSWAPVASDLPLWYAVEFYYASDQNADGQLDSFPLQVEEENYYFTGTSLWFPESAVPVGIPFMFRIFAFDGSDGSTYNNYSRSVMVGYGGPGYDYSTLKDADGDGYASNIDSDDTNALVNPFPYPVITAFTMPASSAGLTVPITALTGNGTKIASGCLSEVNNSASCSWTSAKPVSYSFASAGPHTLYAFIRDASGNISASAAAQTVITLSNAQLTLNFSGTGTGKVTGGMSCSTGASCTPVSFSSGAQVTLNPAAGSDSIFTGWSGDCVVSGNSCTVALTVAKSVTAGFAVMPPVWVTSGTLAANYFGTLSDAYNSAGNGAVIKAKVSSFSENLLLNRGIGITVKGGFNAGYLSNLASRSILHGTLTVRSGSLVAEGLAIN